MIKITGNSLNLSMISNSLFRKSMPEAFGRVIFAIGTFLNEMCGFATPQYPPEMLFLYYKHAFLLQIQE